MHNINIMHDIKKKHAIFRPFSQLHKFKNIFVMASPLFSFSKYKNIISEIFFIPTECGSTTKW